MTFISKLTKKNTDIIVYALILKIFLTPFAALSFDYSYDSPDHQKAALELTKKRLQKLWHEHSGQRTEQRMVIVYLTRKAYKAEYSIPPFAQFMMKDEGFNPENKEILQAVRELFELTDAKDPFCSDVKKKNH